MLGRRASLFNEDYPLVVTRSSYHRHVVEPRRSRLLASALPHFVLTKPQGCWLSKHYRQLTWDCCYLPTTYRGPGSSSEGFEAPERSENYRTRGLQNCFLWGARAEFHKVSHALGSDSAAGNCQQVSRLAGEWPQLCSWQPRGPYKFCVRIVLLF